MAQVRSGLKKDLGLLDVYSIAMGTTLSSGFFLLPGLAFAAAGQAMVTSYMVAALLVVPAMFAMVELSTAMPRAGGAYYFLDRSMGPLIGTVGGLGTWLVLILKSAFALIGLGAYVGLFFPNLPIVPLAIVMALVFGGLNLAGAKKSGSLQVVLVVGLILILSAFMVEVRSTWRPGTSRRCLMRRPSQSSPPRVWFTSAMQASPRSQAWPKRWQTRSATLLWGCFWHSSRRWYSMRSAPT